MKDNYLSMKTFSLLIISFLLVAFGQPAWSWWTGLLASIFGFALFWSVLLDVRDKWRRVIMAAGWYAGVQVVQLSWMASHPYSYIYGVILLCAWLTGAQFGVLAYFMQPSLFERWIRLAALAGLWTMMEWSRLFWLSGLSFNPAGLAITGSIYPLQFAAIGGIYLLSFWVILTNLLVLRIWVKGISWSTCSSAMTIILIPYVFGAIHLLIHEQGMQKSPQMGVVLVQTAVPVEKREELKTPLDVRHFVMREWLRIFSFVKPHQDSSPSLIVLPEYVVLYGTFYPAFPLSQAKTLIKKSLGKEALHFLPPLNEPYASYVETDRGEEWFVTNAFFAQVMANFFQADVVVGLEDKEWDSKESYSSAFHFAPGKIESTRYDKRVLVPMGEYIPFSFCRQMAAQYGITGSFTCGTEAKVFHGKMAMSPSICYEETYGHLMREGRLLGANLMVNLTSDAWFPSSRLPQQHFDHARLRTVENGIPLIRSCNTGMTAAVDSLGRDVSVWQKENAFASQWAPGALFVNVPTYNYSTLYVHVGDYLILALSLCFVCVWWLKRE